MRSRPAAAAILQHLLRPAQPAALCKAAPPAPRHASPPISEAPPTASGSPSSKFGRRQSVTVRACGRRRGTAGEGTRGLRVNLARAARVYIHVCLYIHRVYIHRVYVRPYRPCSRCGGVPSGAETPQLLPATPFFLGLPCRAARGHACFALHNQLQQPHAPAACSCTGRCTARS